MQTVSVVALCPDLWKQASIPTLAEALQHRCDLHFKRSVQKLPLSACPQTYVTVGCLNIHSDVKVGQQ